MATYATFSMDQGADFSASIYLTDDSGYPLNLESSIVAASMRRSYPSTVSHTLTTSVISGSSGIISISMPAATNSLLKPGRYVYDIVTHVSGSSYNRVLEGVIELNPAVTRVLPTTTN